MKTNNKLQPNNEIDLCEAILNECLSNPLNSKLLLQVLDPELNSAQLVMYSGQFMDIIKNTLENVTTGKLKGIKFIEACSKVTNQIITLMVDKDLEKTREILIYFLTFNKNKVVKSLFCENKEYFEENYPYFSDLVFDCNYSLDNNEEICSSDEIDPIDDLSDVDVMSQYISNENSEDFSAGISNVDEDTLIKSYFS